MRRSFFVVTEAATSLTDSQFVRSDASSRKRELR